MLQRRTLVSGLTAAALARPARAKHPSERILFQQPKHSNGIAPNFSVTGAFPAYNPIGAFYLHANQPNPYRSDNDFVPVTWDATMLTGLHVNGNPADWQRGIRPDPELSAHGHTVAQIHHDAVGAFLNSRDLIQGSPGNRMMIAAGYEFPDVVAPFATDTASLVVSLDLQVPTATDSRINGVSNTYCKADVLLVCIKTGARVSVSFGLFANQQNPQHDGVGFDDISRTVIIGALVSPLGQLVQIQPGSSMFQNQPWMGWRSFSVVMTRAHFLAGLAAAAPVAASYGYRVSMDPADYVLSTTHLNAELHYRHTHPATLGWSMRKLTIAART